jgi:hypothetical protein
MDGCFGATGFPASSVSLNEDALISTPINPIGVGDGQVTAQGVRIKVSNEEVARTRLVEFPEELLYTIAQMLNPACALAVDKELKEANKPIYTEAERAYLEAERTYLNLAQQWQSLTQISTDYGAVDNEQDKAEVLSDLYTKGWSLLSVSASNIRPALEVSLAKLLKQLPQHKAWTGPPSGFFIQHDTAYLRLLDSLLACRQVAHTHAQTSSSQQIELENIYQRTWKLLQQPEVLHGRPELVDKLMQLLLKIPQETGWDSNPEVFSEVFATVTLFFSQLAKIQADHCLQLMIQSLPAEAAIKTALSVFDFSEQELDMFVATVYEHGNPPIWAAVQHNRPDLVEKLIQMQADINVKDVHGIPLLVLAAARGYKEIVAILINCAELLVNSQDATACSALYWACQQKHTDIALLLIADERTELNEYSLYGFNPLHIAAMENLTEVVEALLAKASLNPTLKDKNRGLTSAQWAEENGYQALADTLFQHEKQWQGTHQF